MSSDSKRSFAALSSSNWGQWSDNMEAYLATKELWEYIDGSNPMPVAADATKPTADERKELVEWKRKANKASGEIWLSVEDDQKVYIKEVKGDPAAMWKKLEDIHLQKKPGARFNAYDVLFSIRKDENETLTALMARADKAMQDIKALRPSGFSLDDLDKELLSMTLIRALPSEFNNFASSLLLLDSLDLNKLKSAFQTEESQRLARNSLPSSTLASAAQSSSLTCFFCGRQGHGERECLLKQKASEEAKKKSQQSQQSQDRKRSSRRPRNAKEASVEKDNSPELSNAVEFAGHASSTLPSSLRPKWLKSKASANWNTDTGASAHMTPHKHWFRSYSPHVTAIRLANDQIIHSAGIGSIEFQPLVEGIPERPVVFHNVLHVPDLASNLLALFVLSRKNGYLITIENDKVKFLHSKQLHFTATVTDRNVGYLDGHVIVPAPHTPESACVTSTCPLDFTLWHRRCSHLNLADLKSMHSSKLVTGMVIKSKSAPDPICEPCILGKQHRHNIPKAASSRKSRVLQLVHTDLKGPLPVQTSGGHKYWQIFVDDKSRWRTIAFLRMKSDALSAFKQYKASAEKQTGKPLLCSRDDKGGEFISKEFNDFCANEGIRRQHTEPNEPHQNGVAERANRDIAAGATALLIQAKLPPSFWNFAVAAYIHTSNRTPTSALGGITPYQVYKGKKPDVSYFRVFGCLAYVLIRKEKRKALQPHSKACIFIGYPEGVKAWQFWDPVEKKVIISSHAVFDEWCFPGNSTQAIDLLSSTLRDNLPKEPTLVLHQGGDEVNSDEAPAPTPVALDEPAPPVPDPDPLPSAPASPLPGTAPAPVPIPALAPIHAPAPASTPVRRANPPRTSRHQGSLNESALERRNKPLNLPTRPSPVPSSSPDPLSLQTPEPAPHVVPAPVPIPPQPASPLPSDSSSDDEILLKDQSEDELEYADAVQAGLTYLVDGQHYAYLTWDEGVDYAFSTMESALKTSCHDGEPQSYAEAMALPEEERIKWHKAALDEIQALMDNGTFELVQLPPGRKAIGSRWVFKVKKNADGSIERYKGRLVAQGYSQRPGFDFTETFAPTPKWAALRAVLALAAIEDLHLESVDISSAFLNGTLEEEVYMRQPPGFVQKGNDWVWRLLKSLYGLKQAGRCWHKKLNEVLQQMGFARIVCEHSIWIYRRDDIRIIIPVFIDDMTIAAKSKDAIDKVIGELKLHFKLRELGPTSWLLGVEIIRNRSTRTLSLSQRQYILSLLNRFKLSDVNPVSTPMDPSIKLSSDMCPTSSKDLEEMKSIPYLQAVGALMYLAISTRPDISYAVGVLARFNKNPGMAHWKAVKHLFRYLKGTLNYKLTYSPDPSSSDLFTTYADADHGGNLDNGRSTTGYVVKMGTGAISWSSKLQSIVALSTTEAEYVAATSAGQEILWLRNLFQEIGYSLNVPSPLWLDNQSALSVAKNPEHHGRMKHLDLRFYWLRDEVDKGTIQVAHLRTDDMPADVLTKPLARIKLASMRQKLGLQG